MAHADAKSKDSKTRLSPARGNFCLGSARTPRATNDALVVGSRARKSSLNLNAITRTSSARGCAESQPGRLRSPFPIEAVPIGLYRAGDVAAGK